MSSSSIPIISVVGRSGSGKTTLLEKLIRELKRRGYRLAVVKHHYHAGLQFDVPGKDSQRLAEAGADRVVMAAPDQLVSVQHLDHEPTLAEVAATIRDVDLIITEGFKREHAPKIQVSRAELGGGTDAELLCPQEELVAFVADHPFAVQVPRFGLEDIAGVADLIEARFLTPRSR